MLKRIALLMTLLIVSVGAALHFSGKEKTEPPTVAFIDRDALPSEIKNEKDTPDRLSKAASSIAAKNHYLLVLDKKVVVSGAVDVTSLASAYLQGKKQPARRTETASTAPVGIIDQEALLKLPELHEAREKYAELFSSFKSEYQKKSAGLSKEGKEALMESYSEQLSAAQKELVQPFFSHLEKTVRSVAKEKGLVCVFSREDVYYGGVDITNDVFVRAKERLGNEKSGMHEPPAGGLMAIAVVDPSKLVPVHPLALRAKELDREIDAWSSGRYGIAMTLLSEKERDEWENARLKAQKNWDDRLAALTKDEQNVQKNVDLTPEKLAEIEAALNETYKQELANKMSTLEKGFNAQVKDAQTEAEKSIRSYADDLLKFRNQKLSSRQEELLGKLARDMKNEETRLQEEYLQFEKQLLDADQQKKLDLQLKLEVAAEADKPALENQLDAITKREEAEKSKKQKALGKTLSDFQEKGLSHVRETLQQLAATLDREAADKIKKRHEELLTASKEALTDEQKSLQMQLAQLKTEAAKEAEKKVSTRFGDRSTQLIVHQTELNQKMAALRLQIEAKLSQEEKKILAQSKAYAKISEAIKTGDRKIVGNVISDLKNEENSVTSSMQKDILAEASARGKEEGFNLVVTGLAVNVSAHDLTRELARQFAAVSFPDFQEVNHHS